MRQVFVIAVRALGRMASQFTTVFAAGLFLAAVGVLYAKGLSAAEGTLVAAAAVWAQSVMVCLPMVTAFLTMRLWNDEGQSDRTEIDLVVPVAERAFAAGRFAAAYVLVALVLLLSLVTPLVILPRCAPAIASGLSIAGLVPVFVVLLLFAVPLTAVGSLAGACFRHSVLAAVAAISVTCVVPQIVYRALFAWSPAVRMRFAEAPVDALIADASGGLFPVSAVLAAIAFGCLAVYVASKVFALRRLVCDGRLVLKASSVLAIVSAFVATGLFSAFVLCLDVKVEWPGTRHAAVFSARTREILSGNSQPVHVTVCLRRDSPAFLSTSRLLRAFAAEARSAAGAKIDCRFVDPRWDPEEATPLVRAGGGEGTIVFSLGRRRIVVPVKDADEGVCASAIQRLSMPVKAENVLFTIGHGEPSIDDFGPMGLGDAVRALRQDGYTVGTLFTATSSVPADCSVVAVVGARTPFSAEELRMLEVFVSQGGRLLATISASREAGVQSLIESYGITPVVSGESAPTTDGSDIVATGFGDHVVSRPLEGSAVLFAADALRFKQTPPSAVHADGFALTPLCSVGTEALALAAEKGAALKNDLAIRPARVVVIGDPSFLMNGALASRANANRDFFLNAVAWLAGLDLSGSTGTGGNVLQTQMDRTRRIRFLVVSAVVFPSIVALFGALFVVRRRMKA